MVLPVVVFALGVAVAAICALGWVLQHVNRMKGYGPDQAGLFFSVGPRVDSTFPVEETRWMPEHAVQAEPVHARHNKDRSAPLAA
jgi:hypothetical protein